MDTSPRLLVGQWRRSQHGNQLDLAYLKLDTFDHIYPRPSYIRASTSEPEQARSALENALMSTRVPDPPFNHLRVDLGINLIRRLASKVGKLALGGIVVRQRFCQSVIGVQALLERFLLIKPI